MGLMILTLSCSILFAYFAFDAEMPEAFFASGLYLGLFFAAVINRDEL